jgi:hypothetical protein
LQAKRKRYNQAGDDEAPPEQQDQVLDFDEKLKVATTLYVGNL